MASIRERPTNGGETTFNVMFRDGGKQSSETFITRASAEKFKTLVELIGPGKARAEMFGQQQDGLTVDHLAERFFAVKAGDVTARTIADYRRDYANWIRPHLGHRQAESIDELDVQRVVDTMRDRGLDPKSVADRHMILSSMYRWGSAKTRRLVTHNPCMETELPERKKKTPKGLTIPEWQQFHDVGCRDLPDVGDMALFLVGTGWRWSEAAALTVRNVEDWGSDGVFVSVSQVLRTEPGRTGFVAEGEAKSQESLRRTRVGATLAAMLARRTVGKGPDAFVFTNAQGSRWHQANFLNRHWSKAVEASGLDRKPTPHWLRHTHALLLDRAGATLPEMRRRLGHADIQTTINVYGGMIGDVRADVLDRADDLLAGRASTQIVAGAVIPQLDGPAHTA